MQESSIHKMFTIFSYYVNISFTNHNYTKFIETKKKENKLLNISDLAFRKVPPRK